MAHVARLVESPTGGAPRRRFRAWIDALLALGLVYMLGLNLATAIDTADRNARIRAVAAEARILYDALERYRDRNGAYPGSWRAPALELDTLDPLASRGYYRGPLTRHLVQGRVDAYEAPEGDQPEYWIEMTLADDPSIRFLLARSDDSPLGAGKWREGVYVYRRGTLEPL